MIPQRNHSRDRCMPYENAVEMKNLILFTILMLTLSCQTKEDMNELQKSIVENYLNSYNDFDIDGMTKDLTDNVVFENVSNGKV